MARPDRFIALLLAGVLCAAPALGYIVYLKDGSRLIAKEKYTISGPNAIIILQNGAQTMIAASEIDVATTEEINKTNPGSAMVLEGGKVTDLPQATPPPTQTRLKDLINNQTIGLRTLPESRRPKERSNAAGSAPKTLAGYEDFAHLARAPYNATEIAATLTNGFQGQGFEGVQIFQGTTPKRPLLEITTASEASVFRALLTSAQSLLSARQHHGDAVEALDVLLLTPNGARAGQFVLSPDQAADLMSRKADLTAFYVENVQF